MHKYLDTNTYSVNVCEVNQTLLVWICYPEVIILIIKRIIYRVISKSVTFKDLYKSVILNLIFKFYSEGNHVETLPNTSPIRTVIGQVLIDPDRRSTMTVRIDKNSRF